MNILLVKIQVLSQVLLDKLNLSILHWVKFFNKGLDKDEDKKEGLLKRLKKIEDKNEELLKVKNKVERIKEVTDFVDEHLSLEAKELIEGIRIIQKDVDYKN